MIDASNVFNPKDFESARLIIYFRNFTIGTEVKDTNKVSLVEMGHRTLVFEVPEKSCNVKHNVTIEITQKEKDKKKEKPLLAVTGKVLSVEEVGDRKLRVTVDCVQFDEQSWEKLVSFYSNRQEEITNFLKAVKG